MASSGLYISCTFPARSVTAIVELSTADAPDTCEALLRQLPVETDTYHSKWGGQQVFIVLPPLEGPTARPQLTTPQQGDVVLYWHGPGYRGAPRHLRAAGLASYCELAICYGPRVRAFGPDGEQRGVRVGQIVEGLDVFAQAVQDMRQVGFEVIRLDRRA